MINFFLWIWLLNKKISVVDKILRTTFFPKKKILFSKNNQQFPTYHVHDDTYKIDAYIFKSDRMAQWDRKYL